MFHKASITNPVCINDDTPDFKVCDLIDHSTRSWDIGKLSIFDQNTQAAILAIPLAAGNSHDNLFWSLNVDGRYSTKSGYWVSRMGVGSQMGISNNLWSKVWSIKGPPKMRHFLWPACKGSLPVNVVRFRRHMHSSAMCTRCNEDDESICHALLNCPDSRDVWLSSPFYTLINAAPLDSFEDLFVWLHSHTKNDELPLICATLWACWIGRNKKQPCSGTYWVYSENSTNTSSMCTVL